MLAAAGDTTRNRLTEIQTTRLFLIFLSHTRSHLLHQKEKRQMLSHLLIRNSFDIFYGMNCLYKWSPVCSPHFNFTPLKSHRQLRFRIHRTRSGLHSSSRMSKAWRVFGERLEDLRCDKRLSVQAIEGVRCRARFRRATKRRVASRRGDCMVRVFRWTSPHARLRRRENLC